MWAVISCAVCNFPSSTGSSCLVSVSRLFIAHLLILGSIFTSIFLHLLLYFCAPDFAPTSIFPRSWSPHQIYSPKMVITRSDFMSDPAGKAFFEMIDKANIIEFRDIIQGAGPDQLRWMLKDGYIRDYAREHGGFDRYAPPSRKIHRLRRPSTHKYQQRFGTNYTSRICSLQSWERSSYYCAAIS